jgi:hypothetical protein
MVLAQWSLQGRNVTLRYALDVELILSCCGLAWCHPLIYVFWV